ncbi:sugar ABC transporter ATP-binding protein [Pelagibius litoralis]|uniref:Sugar ABC transporter ATP-binding protein n=1 Tax=Pelagibius litoralis TaxID=374515 RepID=A0A967EZZ4_9PROT|nr:ATP-binding cassette domain-containing protein [Pelagibius litoralis]NIA70593.1 sugar ABC transporter ATP-binding protein [Pelagibius litoralis]
MTAVGQPGIPAATTPLAETPLVEMVGIEKHFGGVIAVDHVSIDLRAGEVVGVLGHNGAGKSCLMRILSGAMEPSEGRIRVGGNDVTIASPSDARALGIETIYQTLALADHLDAPANLFMGRELKTRFGNLDDKRMLREARQVIQRLNPNFKNLSDPVSKLSGGQRQVIAIARAIYFNVKILIMDEPTAALGPSETAMVAELIKRLSAEGIGIFLVSHDMHDVFDLCDRVVVMNKGRNVGAYPIDHVSKDDVLSLIVKGSLPDEWLPRSSA